VNAENLNIGASEVLQFAIKIEENGWRFYNKVAEANDDEKVKDLFTFLADEEIKHKETFEAMLPEIDKYEPREVYPPEYFAYLRAYADNIIFKHGVEKDLSEDLEPVSAVDFGIIIEVDSIAYYNEVKNFVPQNQRSVIDKIIEEERKHFLKLSNLKKEFLK
jgi:rubrerythrin